MTSVAAPVLIAQGIAKRYGATSALAGVDFAVEPGRVHALIGENGAGKSTLVKILAGVEQPTSGELRFQGERVQFASPRAAGSGSTSSIRSSSSFPSCRLKRTCSRAVNV
jgi:ABC-type sugar transport system ATPase subunit